MYTLTSIYFVRLCVRVDIYSHPYTYIWLLFLFLSFFHLELNACENVLIRIQYTSGICLFFFSFSFSLSFSLN